jgi:uncharacterized membrane protein YhaH (DUF805 family)
MKWFGALFVGDDGKVSHQKFWHTIGCSIMTAAFINFTLTESLPEWYGYLYAVVVVAPNLITKLTHLKWGLSPKSKND